MKTILLVQPSQTVELKVPDDFAEKIRKAVILKQFNWRIFPTENIRNTNKLDAILYDEVLE